MNWKKILTIALCVVLFGALACGTVFGVQYLGGKAMTALQNQMDQKEETRMAETPAEEAATVKEETKAEPETQALKTVSSESSGTTIKKAEPLPATAYIAVDVSGIVEESMPEVVAITNTSVIQQQGYSSIYDYFYGRGTVTERTQTASGSGVIIKETADELLIVTNNHVIENAQELAVTFIDGETVDAKIKGYDGDIDLAVIAIPLSDIKESTKEEIKVAVLHDNEDLRCGQGVIAIGNALGYGQSVTVGVISALGRKIEDGYNTYEDLIQTDAAINPGNSGGALLNNNGELIGINVAKFSETSVEGVGFSIPVYKAMEIIENLSNARTKEDIPEENQGRLGIYMNTIDSMSATALNIPAGVIVVGFSDEKMEGNEDQPIEESPAREAGILKNDIITKFDGQGVTDAQALANLCKYYEAGTEVDITVQRLNNGEYEEKVITVTLGKKNVTESSDEDGDKKESGKKPSKKEDEEKSSGKEDEKKKDDGKKKDDREDDGFGDEDDMYDLFRKFLEQYQ